MGDNLYKFVLAKTNAAQSAGGTFREIFPADLADLREF